MIRYASKIYICGKIMAKNTAPDAKVPRWIWLLTIVALAGLVMFLILLSKLEPPAISIQNSKSNTTIAENPNKEKQYDFYQRLRDAEIPVTATEKKASKTKPADKSIYLLQVASFKVFEDAEQVRVELMLLGLNAQIEKANTDKGGAWHRIIVGPFKSRSKLQKARSVLLSNRYEALLLKRKPSKK